MIDDGDDDRDGDDDDDAGGDDDEDEDEGADDDDEVVMLPHPAPLGDDAYEHAHDCDDDGGDVMRTMNDER